MTQSNQPPPADDHWQFPCQVNVKVMGKAQFDMVNVVSDVLTPLDDQFDASTISVKTSSKGKFVSVTAVVNIVDKNHLESVYRALSERDEVAWTL